MTSKRVVEYHLLDDFGEVVRIVKCKWTATNWYNNGGLFDKKLVEKPKPPGWDLPDAPY